MAVFGNSLPWGRLGPTATVMMVVGCDTHPTETQTRRRRRGFSFLDSFSTPLSLSLFQFLGLWAGLVLVLVLRSRGIHHSRSICGRVAKEFPGVLVDLTPVGPTQLQQTQQLTDPFLPDTLQVCSDALVAFIFSPHTPFQAPVPSSLNPTIRYRYVSPWSPHHHHHQHKVRNGKANNGPSLK
jgi:hypothetical protein